MLIPMSLAASYKRLHRCPLGIRVFTDAKDLKASERASAEWSTAAALPASSAQNSRTHSDPRVAHLGLVVQRFCIDG